MAVLTAAPNQFGGIVVAPDELPQDADEFRQRLEESLGTWEEAGYKLVWLEVPVRRARLIPIAVEAGFGFHHSDEGYLLLTRRLMPDAFIPLHATHYIGVGGVVVNDRQELLVVSERYRRDNRPYYKLPGGQLQPGEHLVGAVLREVLEETGVRARFESLICFRHWHGYRYGKSDIYFVCRLAPLSQDLQMQAEELDECLWMPVQDYLSSNLVSPFNKRIVRAALSSPGVVPVEVEGYGDAERYEIFMPVD
ncbi:MAG: NUDIX domain-containing protein [Chloroflexi bacterium]|nr:NUDIX domain-containing protein [Chloroflexota bacterium]